MSPPPTVSIVTATYNRSNILRYTIGSVQRSTFEDWELIVVGDACTDDTAEAVSDIGDPRVRFVNLPENCGDQSGPNNHGVTLARGRYLAFLNHDDLWFPDHLETVLQTLESTGADLVFTLVLGFAAPGSVGEIHGANTDGIYEPWMFVPASCWVARREFMEKVGPWRKAGDGYQIPSQDWLHRAALAGGKLRLAPRVTVLAPYSTIRAGAYARRSSEDQGALFARLLHEPDLRERELTRIALRLHDQALRPAILPFFFQALRNCYRRGCLLFGIAPQSVTNFLRYRRKGGRVAELRRIRGLPAQPPDSKD